MGRVLRSLVGSGRLYRLAAPVPVTVSELVSNGDMEAASGWSSSGSPTSNAQSAEQAHSPTNSRKVVTDASAEGCSQSVSGHANNTWYQATAWVYGTDGSGLQVLLGSMLTGLAYGASNGAWGQVAHCGRSVSGSGSVTIRANAATTFYVDDVSVKALTLASLLSTVALAGQADGRFRTRVTLDANSQAGMVLRLDDATTPANAILCWRDRSKVYLEKVVAGAYTTLINTTTTYVAGQVLECRCNGDQVAVWYGGSQVGATQTISDGVTNTRHGLMSTWAGNVVGPLWVGAK